MECLFVISPSGEISSHAGEVLAHWEAPVLRMISGRVFEGVMSVAHAFVIVAHEHMMEE